MSKKPQVNLETRYEVIGKDIGELVQRKQKAYGNSFGKAHRIILELYPDGVPPEAYEDLLTITRILDKLFRIATNNDPDGESPYRDIAGYAILALGRETSGVNADRSSGKETF